MYEKLSEKYNDKVAFGKIDVDDNSDAALEYEIASVPTFIFFSGANADERFSGADPGKFETLIKELDERP